MLIAIQASIGFFNSIGIFDQTYYETPSNQYNYADSKYDEYKSMNEDPGLLDQVQALAKLAIDGLFMMLNVLLTVAFVLPTLIRIFGIDPAIAVALQGMVYFIYLIGWAQWKSGKSIQGYQ